jgi:hypothetical protein
MLLSLKINEEENEDESEPIHSAHKYNKHGNS